MGSHSSFLDQLAIISAKITIAGSQRKTRKKKTGGILLRDSIGNLRFGFSPLAILALILGHLAFTQIKNLFKKIVRKRDGDVGSVHRLDRGCLAG